VWIAQEILIPDGFKIFIFDGVRHFEMTLLGRYLREIFTHNQPPIPPFGKTYFDWRADKLVLLRIIDPFQIRNLDRPTPPSLLYCFSSCACQIKRDRIFALLPLLIRNLRVEADYDVDIELLFRRILGQHRLHNSIDELMAFGATLIEALEMRSPVPQIVNTSATTSDSTPSK
jgi:hypothetical protein